MKSVNVVESKSSSHRGSSFEEPEEQRDNEEEEEDEDDDERDNLEKYSISSITIPDYILSASGADSDIYQDDEGEEDDDDATVQINNVGKKIIHPDEVLGYDQPRAQIDTGAKVTVTNLLYLLHDAKFYSDTFPCKVRMQGATSKRILYPEAIGLLRIPALNDVGYVDVECHYSPEFTSTLLSNCDLLKTAGKPSDYTG